MLQFFTLLSLAIALVQGLVLPEFTTQGVTGPVKIDFNVSNTVGDISAQEFWSKRSNTLAKRGPFSEVAVPYRNIAYHMDVYLGSNRQKATVILDTGSSDLWVPSDNYNPATSSSSQSTGETFQIGYLDGTNANGQTYLDTFQFETPYPVLSNFKFARSTSTGGFGVLGVADRNQEATPTQYDNLPWALQKAGVIPKASYSLILNRVGQSGSVLFGGIDTAKYNGKLAQYSIDTRAGGLGITLQTLGMEGHEYPAGVAVFLDSGTTLGLLNSQLMARLDNVFHPTIINYGGIQYRQVSCSQPSDRFLDFHFGANAVSIAYSDLIFRQGDGTCLLGFGWYNDYNILGAVFLRSAYVHFDLSNQQISIAQASYSSASNVISD
ncbi:hypothetical protein JCM33374_g2549 [Metschnikowia sp. JCM 33374]|nr:hypothetical protein JCM33374_g2549 [Metschnikowia sp. JCM 33374]